MSETSLDLTSRAEDKTQDLKIHRKRRNKIWNE